MGAAISHQRFGDLGAADIKGCGRNAVIGGDLKRDAHATRICPDLVCRLLLEKKKRHLVHSYHRRLLPTPLLVMFMPHAVIAYLGDAFVFALAVSPRRLPPRL